MRRAIRSKSGITGFITLWVVAMLIAVVTLGGGLLVATRKLNVLSDSLYADATSLDRAHLFESAILSEGREDLLWRATRDPAHLKNKLSYLREADKMIGELDFNVSPGEERALLNEVIRRYRLFRALAVMGEQSSTETLSAVDPRRRRFQSHERSRLVSASLESLLQVVQKHRGINTQQMQDTMARSNEARASIDHVSLIILFFASLILLAGGALLWLRIFEPTVRLAEAARAFGDGDLKARARVVRQDEMGALCNTFNTMADSVCDRERERLDFVATIAHDLKNPLVIIGGASHLLRDRSDRLSAEDQDLWLGRIENNARRLEAMIADMMDGVQIQTGRLVLSSDEVDMAELTRAVVEDFAETKPNRVLHGVYPQHACLLRGDRKRLERVLANLISNALKYSEADRPVHVVLSVQDGQAHWTIRDEGVGIAPEDLPRLFLPFSRLDRTRKMASGTGLGLVSAKKIVEAHEGSLEVSSQLAKGTTVTVQLPMRQ